MRSGPGSARRARLCSESCCSARLPMRRASPASFSSCPARSACGLRRPERPYHAPRHRIATGITDGRLMNVIATPVLASQPEHSERVRTLFISDLHLGTRGCQADKLLEFLRDYDADCIYLIGDIVDGWQLRSGWYWPQTHNDVVQKLLRKARKGTRIIYIPGNHDEFLRQFYGTHFGGIEVVENAIHTTADGRR